MGILLALALMNNVGKVNEVTNLAAEIGKINNVASIAKSVEITVSPKETKGVMVTPSMERVTNHVTIYSDGEIIDTIDL